MQISTSPQSSSPHQQAQSQLADQIAKFHYDPLGFVMFAYPWGEKGPLENYDGPDTWQRDFLIEWGKELKKRRFNGVDPVPPVRMTRSSGHGIGKGVLSAFICNFVMSTRPNSRGTVTANTYGQLETKTWASIQKWTKLCVTSDWFEVTGNMVYRKGMRETWFAAAISCAEENAQAFAGQHAADSTSFYIIDEGSNVPDAIYNVADGGLTDGEPMIFVLGNPTRSIGKFYRINFGDERHRWNHKAIDSRTCRYTNKVLLQEWKEDWGEDSDRYRVQVKGLPPAASDTQFISTLVVSEAQRREATALPNDPVICGLDISRGGADNCVFRFRKGRDARSMKSVKITGQEARDTTVLVNKAISILNNGVLYDPKSVTITPDTQRMAELYGVPEQTRVVRIDMMFIDGTGVGGPVCDQLRNLGYEKQVTEIQFGADAPNTPGYQECANMRSWMWEVMRVFLNTGAIDSSTDLESDLTGPMFHYRTTDNKLVLESKESMKKRRGTIHHSGSPDEGDALALTFARPVAPRKSVRQAEREEQEEMENWEGGQGRVWG